MEDQNKDSTSGNQVVQPQIGAVMPVQPGAESKDGQGGEGTQPRTYTEVEWNKRQSSFDKQVSKINDRIKELEQAKTTAEAQAQENQFNGWLNAIEDSGGDVGAAKKAIDGIKRAWQETKTILAQKSVIDQHASILEEAGRGKAATDLIKTHGLDESALEQLLDSKDTTEMELKALRLKVEGLTTSVTPSTKVDSFGVKGKETDLTKMPPSEALGVLMEQSLKK